MTILFYFPPLILNQISVISIYMPATFAYIVFSDLFINLDPKILLCLQHPPLLPLLVGQKGWTPCGLLAAPILQHQPCSRRACATTEALASPSSSQGVCSPSSVTVHCISLAVSVNKVISLHCPSIYHICAHMYV